MNTINLTFSALTLLIFAVSFIALLKHKHSYSLKLDKLRRAFNEIAGSQGIPIDQLASSSQQLVSDFCATHDGRRGRFVSFDHERVLLTHPSGAMITPFVSNSFKSVPAILTTTGILGTFVGITLGLGALNTGSTNSVDLVNQTMGLIDGLDTSFVTSIWGMAASLIFMLALSIVVSVQTKARRALVDDIDKKAKLISSNDLLHQLVENQKESKSEQYDFTSLITTLKAIADKPSAMTSEQFLEISEKGSSSVECAIEKLQCEVVSAITTAAKSQNHQLLATKIDEILDEHRQANQGVHAISQMLESMSQREPTSLNQEQLINALRSEVRTPITSSLDETKQHAQNAVLGLEKLLASSASVIKGLDVIASSRKDEFDHLVKKMGVEIVEPITSELHHTNKAVTQFANVSDELNQNVVSSIARLEDTTQKVVDFEQRTLTKLDDFTAAMDRSLNEFAKNSTQALGVISDEVKEIVNLGSLSIETQTSAFSQMVVDSETMFQSQADTLRVVGIESAKLMSTAGKELESGLGDIDRKVHNMSDTVQRELERFRTDYQTNLNKYFTEQTRLLDESLNEQKSGLNEVIGNFRGVFEEEYSKRSSLLNDLDQQYVKLASAAERVQAMAKSLGLENAEWVSQLQLVNNSIGRQVADLGKAYAQSSAQFSQLAENIRPEMDDYFRRANRSVEEYFSAFDATSHRIYSRLDRAVDLMSTMIEEVQREKAQLADQKD